METVGFRLRTLRKKQNLTQKELEKMTGISSGNISSYESDRFLPSAQALIGLSEALECSADYILTGKYTNASLKPEEFELLEHYRILPDEEKEEVLCIVQMKRKKIGK